jgi:hypothetical protein
MARRNVIWTRTADIQFVGVLKYWVDKNKSNTYSKKLVKLVSERTNQISEKPFIYKSPDFKNVRVASLKTFSIYYKVSDDDIIITAIFHIQIHYLMTITNDYLHMANWQKL